MGDLVLGAGLLLATPRELVIAQVVGFAVTLVLHRRQRGIKLAFNVAISALGGSLATIVFAVLSGPRRRCGTGWRRWSPSWSPP